MIFLIWQKGENLSYLFIFVTWKVLYRVEIFKSPWLVLRDLGSAQIVQAALVDKVDGVDFFQYVLRTVGFYFPCLDFLPDVVRESAVYLTGNGMMRLEHSLLGLIYSGLQSSIICLFFDWSHEWRTTNFHMFGRHIHISVGTTGDTIQKMIWKVGSLSCKLLFLFSLFSLSLWFLQAQLDELLNLVLDGIYLFLREIELDFHFVCYLGWIISC